MAAGYIVKTGSAVFSITTGHKTLVNVISSSAKSVLPVEVSWSFDGVTASAVPVSIDIGYSTQATAGTPGTGSITPTLIRGRGTAVTTGAIEYSAEPTVLSAVKHWLLTPNGGLFVLQSPLGREMNNDIGTAANDAIFIGANPPATVGVRAYMEFEEE